MNAAFDMILRPLVRLAIARGIRFAELTERLRRAFLAEARAIAGNDAPVSRINVMTGLQRRDVTRMLETPEPTAPPRPDPLAMIVAKWHADHSGADLPQHGKTGSFDAMVRMIRRDVHPKSMLEALVAAGTVAHDGQNVVLLKGAHVPLEGSEPQIAYLGQNVGDHLNVAVDNVVDAAGGFERAVHYNGLSPDAVAELDTLWREKMDAVLKDMNNRAATLQAQKAGPYRFRAGGYFRKKDTRP